MVDFGKDAGKCSRLLETFELFLSKCGGTASTEGVEGVVGYAHHTEHQTAHIDV